MTRPLYDLYATWATEAGRRQLVAMGRRQRCERVARQLRDRGIVAVASRVGRVSVVDLGPLDRAAVMEAA